MFAVIFEVHPAHDRWQEYLDLARLLRPELIKIDGFIDNVRYRSLTRPGWLLSLSIWRDEKALVRWRTHAGHQLVQQQGRDEVLYDYHLRVGQVTADSHLPDGMVIKDQRLDVTAMSNGAAVTLNNATMPESWAKERTSEQIAAALGLDQAADGLISWDVFQGVLSPSEVILLASWRNTETVGVHETGVAHPTDIRRRAVRVIRDYGKYQRAEAPQYYPDAKPN